MKTLKCALAFALTPFVWQLATAGPVEEVAAATRGFYDALNHADGDGVAKYLLPRGDSFPRNGTELEPEADTAELAARNMRDSFAAGLRFRTSLRDLHVKVYGDAAVATFYIEGSSVRPDKSHSDGSYRASYVWVKDQGQCKVAHFHISPLTGKP